MVYLHTRSPVSCGFHPQRRRSATCTRLMDATWRLPLRFKPRLGRQCSQAAAESVKVRYRTSYHTVGVGSSLTCMYVYV